MRSTFSVLFYLKRKDVRKDGTVPVMGRITIDGGKPSQFSCKFTVNPALWDTESGRMIGRSIAAQEANKMLDGIRVKINGHYRAIMERDGYVTSEKVRNAFLGLEYRHETLLKVYDQFNSDFDKLVEAGMRSKSTRQKYLVVYEHLKEFLWTRYKVSDIALKEIAPAFINDFEMFLRAEKGCTHNTVWVYLMPLRKMIGIAIENGWLLRDPFIKHEISPEETEREFLTKEEIRTLMETRFENPKHELVRDLFVFCCFTGLSYCELYNLSEENIRTYFDENQWIHIARQKTTVVSEVQLLDIPMKILEKYRGTGENGKIFPVPKYSTIRSNIKKILKICGIEKSMSWHARRHTMATTVCLSNNMPIETVSSILGHKNIRTTQIYAKITKEKVKQDMSALARQLNNIEEFAGVAI